MSASGAPALPSPKFARTIDIGLVSGVVIVKPVAGPSFQLGPQDENIPVGSEIDTSKGEVDLRSAFAPGQASAASAVQDAQFRGALFKIVQRRAQHGLTVADLVTTRTMRDRCSAVAGSASSPGQLSKRVLQSLRAQDSSGHFSTRGRYSAATVRGTVWITTYRCDGTLTTVRRGTVDVRDFVSRKTVVVHAGHSYLASAPRGGPALRAG
ncbi:MAG TPA: hypothetical protein VGH24_06625 [Solirubrobacteraceae bacterium]